MTFFFTKDLTKKSTHDKANDSQRVAVASTFLQLERTDKDEITEAQLEERCEEILKKCGNNDKYIANAHRALKDDHELWS
jgi:hypothetical protein